MSALASVSPPSPPPAPPVEPATPGSDAFAALYRAHSQAIHYLALRYLGDPARAQDVTHDVFLKAWRHLGQFRHEAAWRTWLYRIAINHCRNLAASWAARNLVPSSDETLWNDAPDPGDSPLRILEVKELGERISRAMARLPEEYRLLLLLIADERLAYDQIAALTHQSTDAVRGKLHRARKAFAIAFAATA